MSDERWKEYVPRPVFDTNTEFVNLYWKAWELAYDHIREDEGLPQTPYLDEAHWEDTIWIWDTCFMVLFSKYAPSIFPGVESLNNFYVPLHSDSYEPGTFPQNIQHPDNPPLFAWAEYDNYLFTNDTAHIEQLLNNTQYLQKHFEWFDNTTPGFKFQSKAEIHGSSAPVRLEKKPLGYLWGGIQSGMDNTPRKSGLWVDAIAQQGLSALYISRLLRQTGNTDAASEWTAKYEKIRSIINQHYWDQDDGIYYDIDPDTHELLKVKTPASFWPMLAEMCSPEQAADMVKHLQDPEIFGGSRPWVSVARNEPGFTEPHGDYWLGGIWLPLAYMGTKALEKYNYHEEAYAAANNLLTQMLNTYRNFEPHTIWECYSPTADEPASYKGGVEKVRPDFCGWSALGPISLFIENILGFHTVDAPNSKVKWLLHQSDRHGIKNLRFGSIVTDIIYDGNGCITVKSNAPYSLDINGTHHKITSGNSRIEQTPEPYSSV